MICLFTRHSDYTACMAHTRRCAVAPPRHVSCMVVGPAAPSWSHSSTAMRSAVAARSTCSGGGACGGRVIGPAQPPGRGCGRMAMLSQAFGRHRSEEPRRQTSTMACRGCTPVVWPWRVRVVPRSREYVARIDRAEALPPGLGRRRWRCELGVVVGFSAHAHASLSASLHTQTSQREWPQTAHAIIWYTLAH